MKRLFLVGVVGLVLVGCGESDIEKLSNKQDKLSKEISILNAKAVEPAAECDKLSAVYLSLVDKTTSEAEANKKKGIEVCQQAFELQNKALELQGEVVNIQLDKIALDVAKRGE